MEYIETKEFLKQDKKIQKAFLDWWEWETFDLLADKNIRGTIYSLRYVINNKKFITLDNNEIDIENVIPIFTETQIRKFIEDTTGLLLEVQNFGKLGYCIHLNNIEWVEKQYNNLGIDLLQAYWKVALQIAKEEV